MATKNVTASLVLSKVAQEEKIEVGDTDVGTEIENMTNSMAEDKKDELQNYLGTPQMRDSIMRSLMTRKTMERLAEIAQDSDKAKTSEKEEEK